KEWQLVLPQNAKVEVKAPTGLGFDLIYPEGKRSQHIIRLAESSGERLVVNVQVRYPRPFLAPRLPIGPFFVLGTYRQEGVIIVHVLPDALHGKRLVFHRFGDTYPRDIPNGATGADVAAIYKFWNLPGAVRPPQGSQTNAPLELEVKSENSLTDASVEHILHIKPGGRDGLID